MRQSAPEKTERLFFALWPDAVIRREIYAATRQTARASGGRAVPRENLHLTLAFLGSVDAAWAAGARAVASALRGNAFTLALDHLGFWPVPGLVWYGAREVPESGRRLIATLGAGLQCRGLTQDPRPFFPHVTIARKVHEPGKLGHVRVIAWPVQEFVLVRSLMRPSGSDYQVLAAWPLAAGSREL